VNMILILVSSVCMCPFPNMYSCTASTHTHSVQHRFSLQFLKCKPEILVFLIIWLFSLLLRRSHQWKVLPIINDQNFMFFFLIKAALQSVTWSYPSCFSLTENWWLQEFFKSVMESTQLGMMITEKTSYIYKPRIWT
jgi:hypothetical protein